MSLGSRKLRLPRRLMKKWFSILWTLSRPGCKRTHCSHTIRTSRQTLKTDIRQVTNTGTSRIVYNTPTEQREVGPSGGVGLQRGLFFVALETYIDQGDTHRRDGAARQHYIRPNDLLLDLSEDQIYLLGLDRRRHGHISIGRSQHLR